MEFPHRETIGGLYLTVNRTHYCGGYRYDITLYEQSTGVFRRFWNDYEVDYQRFRTLLKRARDIAHKYNKDQYDD